MSFHFQALYHIHLYTSFYPSLAWWLSIHFSMQPITEEYLGAFAKEIKNALISLAKSVCQHVAT
jgi:hypothetical protein